MVIKNKAHILNAHESQVGDIIRKLNASHDGKRSLIVERPNATEEYTTEQLEDRGMVGIYQNGRCMCESCKHDEIVARMKRRSDMNE